MRSFLPIVSVLASATSVVGHSTFQDLWAGTEDFAETCARIPPSNNPVVGATNADIVCNVGGTAGVAGICAAAGRWSLWLVESVTRSSLLYSWWQDDRRDACPAW